MTATNHALTGAFIATVTGQPILALPLAFISHFICDALPHFGIHMKFGSKAMYTWLVVDGSATLGLASLLLLLGVKNPVLLVLASFMAMSPDLAWYFYGRRGLLSTPDQLGIISRFHSRIQWYQKVPGLAIEVIWAAMILFGIVKLQ